MTDLTHERERLAEHLVGAVERAIEGLAKADDLRGDHAAHGLESIGALAELRRAAPEDTRAADARYEPLRVSLAAALNDEAMQAWRGGLRVERVIGRYRRAVAAESDAALLDEGERARRLASPSPAVVCLESRLALAQQRMGLEVVGRTADVSALDAKLAKLDEALRREIVVMAMDADVEPWREATVALVFGGDATRAPWWCSQPPRATWREVIEAARVGIDEVPKRVRDAILDDESIRAAYLEVLAVKDALRPSPEPSRVLAFVHDRLAALGVGVAEAISRVREVLAPPTEVAMPALAATSPSPESLLSAAPDPLDVELDGGAHIGMVQYRDGVEVWLWGERPGTLNVEAWAMRGERVGEPLRGDVVIHLPDLFIGRFRHPGNVLLLVLADGKPSPLVVRREPAGS